MIAVSLHSDASQPQASNSSNCFTSALEIAWLIREKKLSARTTLQRCANLLESRILCASAATAALFDESSQIARMVGAPGGYPGWRGIVCCGVS